MSISSDRLQRLTPLIEAAGVDALLVSNIFNIRYLLAEPALFDDAFPGVLIVTGGKPVLLLDFRYSGLAEAALGGTRMVLREYKGNLFKAVAEVAAELSVTKLGFESVHLSSYAAGKLTEQFSGCEPTMGLVEKVREIKDVGEIARLKAAAAVADGVFDKLVGLVRPGATEAEIAFELEVLMRRAGATAVSFAPIVASGPNSAFPHAQSGSRVVTVGDIVKIDYGCVVEGYCSDMTRVLTVGKATDWQRQTHAAVLRAHDIAIDRLRAGMTGAEVDALARVELEAVGLGEFGHSLGHGVGLQVHEKPRLGQKSMDIMEPGMVFTIEPGLYSVELGGVRIEDMVLLGQNGVEVLTSAPRELLEV